jgi:hypothetical protein
LRLKLGFGISSSNKAIMTKMSCGFRAGGESHHGKMERYFIKNNWMISKI